MDMMMQFIQQNKIWLGFMGLVLLVYFIWMPIYIKKRKRMQRDYLAQHPDAAKVFLTSKALITSEAVSVHQVNSDHPALFTESGKSGFYARPGSNIIVISYTYTRPGILYKNVTKSTGEVRQEIEVEAQRSYMLGFDRDEETFTFEELSE